MQLHISIAAETIGHFLGLPITNSLLTTWIVMAIILIFAFFATKSIKLVPQGAQFIAELLIGGMYEFIKGMTGEEKVKKIFPLAITIFIFVLISNWIGLVPGISAIGINESEQETVTSETAEVPNEEAATTATESAKTTVDDHGQPIAMIEETVEPPIAAVEETEVHAEEGTEKHATFVPLFRGPTADLNTTLALALFSVGGMIYFGVSALGLSFFKRYFNFGNPILFFVGILEIVSDVSKILSFAFRLFGNIFAGEVLLAVIGYLVPVIATIPFLGLELFVGAVQALVFAMLTAVFIGMATTAHDEHSQHKSGEHAEVSPVTVSA